MGDYLNELGTILLRLCEMSRQHNVDIRIRRVPGDLTGDRFELQLDRGDYHAVEKVDIAPIPYTLPDKTLAYAFERAKYNIKQLQLGGRKNENN